MSNCYNEHNNDICNGGKIDPKNIGYSRTESIKNSCYEGESYPDILYNMKRKRCGHHHCDENVNTECCRNEISSCEKPKVKCSPICLGNIGSQNSVNYRTCVDSNGCAYKYPSCCRDPFWPNFTHPRWLSCSYLYKGVCNRYTNCDICNSHPCCCKKPVLPPVCCICKSNPCCCKKPVLPPVCCICKSHPCCCKKTSCTNKIQPCKSNACSSCNITPLYK